MKTLLTFLFACMLCAVFHSNQVEAKSAAKAGVKSSTKGASKKAANKKDFGPDDWYVCSVVSMNHEKGSTCLLGKRTGSKFKAMEVKKLSVGDAEKIADIEVALDEILGGQFPAGANECVLQFHPIMPNLSPPGSTAIVTAIGVEVSADEVCKNFDEESLDEMRGIVAGVYWLEQRYTEIVEEKQKKEAAELKAKGPQVLVLDNDMSPIQLADFLDSKGLKGAHFFDNSGLKRGQEQDNNCWRGDVPEGVRVAKKETRPRGEDQEAWPVIWHGFWFDRSVLVARVKDQYTGKMADEVKGKNWALGGADRWNPYKCKDEREKYSTHGLGQDYFPEFKKGDGVYVMPK